MASNTETLQKAILGIPRVAERVGDLPEEKREKALKAVELSYLRTVLESDYTESDAQGWVSTVMDTLRAELADQVRHKSQVTVDRDGFASLERLIKLLVAPGPAPLDGGSSASAEDRAPRTGRAKQWSTYPDTDYDPRLQNRLRTS
jgi:hypothetical protein